MLPGFRFLFAAIVLSMSVLVFGLGAAALLRAAHEEFASTPAWQAPPETKFAQQIEATPPVMAMLRVEPPAAEKAPDNVPPVPSPMEETTAAASTPAAQDAVVATPADPAATDSAPAEPETIAALKPEEATPPAPEMPTAEIAAPTDATPVQAETPPVVAEAGTAATEQQVAPPAPVPPLANETTEDRAAEPVNGAQVSPSTDTASTKVATLGGPPVTVESQPPPAVNAKPDRSAIEKRQQARRAAQRRRIAARARLAQQPLPADPFAPAAPAAPAGR
jgi:hypothetical protein